MDGGRDFAAFYAASYPQVVGQVYALVGNLHDAEELTQEAFARAYANWARVGGYDVPVAWVRRVAFNLASTGFRRAGRGAAALLRLGPPEPVLPVSVEAAAVMEALGRLPMRYRSAVVLHHLVDLSVEEVAAELGVPAATVKTRLVRGRRALAAMLGGERLGEESHACR
jgi:RNA polymerase sigma-70 factor (ECF subfamily)